MAPINLSQITLDDALNDPNPLSFDAPQRPPQRPPQTARITCRVCARKEDVPVLAAGLLCGHCRADLDATERHIRETLASAEQAFCDALDAWNAAYNQASDDDQAWFQRVTEARATTPKAEFDRKYQIALDNGGTRAALLRAKAACDEVAARVQGRLAVWAERAMEEVKEARDG